MKQMKIYLYCTEGEGTLMKIGESLAYHSKNMSMEGSERLNGTVFGECTLRGIIDCRVCKLSIGGFYLSLNGYVIGEAKILDDMLKEMCMTEEKLFDYLGLKKEGHFESRHCYLWSIVDFKLYKEPVSLSEQGRLVLYGQNGKPIKRAPQSWCYVRKTMQNDNDFEHYILDNAILLSLNPIYAFWIAVGKKSLEVRKTAPKIEEDR